LPAANLRSCAEAAEAPVKSRVEMEIAAPPEVVLHLLTRTPTGSPCRFTAPLANGPNRTAFRPPEGGLRRRLALVPMAEKRIRRPCPCTYRRACPGASRPARGCPSEGPPKKGRSFAASPARRGSSVADRIDRGGDQEQAAKRSLSSVSGGSLPPPDSAPPAPDRERATGSGRTASLAGSAATVRTSQPPPVGWDEPTPRRGERAAEVVWGAMVGRG
jgi:hypothetical protein